MATYTGTAGNNDSYPTITRDNGTGSDTLYGYGGDDTLQGYGGSDILYGGIGNDFLLGNAKTNKSDADGGDTIYGEDGNDTLYGFAGYDSLYGGAGDDILYGNAATDPDPTDGADYLSGGEGRDKLYGQDGDDSLYGGDGDDELSGGAGNDYLDGGDGYDEISGGAGVDTAIYTFYSGDVTARLATGVVSFPNSGLLSEQLSSIENIQTGAGNDNVSGDAAANFISTGDGDDSLSGGARDDVLFGDNGADVLDGGLGADVMVGGSGNDRYYVDDADDKVVEYYDYSYYWDYYPYYYYGYGAGTDLVYASITHTLPEYVENLELIGSGAIDGTGNSVANVLTGNGADNTLLGLDGDDRLFGRGGNDILDGGAGADRMEGGDGDDSYMVERVGEVIVEEANKGRDRVKSLVTYTLAANLEDLSLEGPGRIEGTGNALANVITGTPDVNFLYGMGGDDILKTGDGDDSMDGGAGADQMSGGRGDDNYIVDNAGDLVIESLGFGTDRVRTSVSYELTAHVEILELVGSAANGTGNDLANSIAGTAGANRLLGLGGSDILASYGGNDFLDGGSGADQMDAGDGDDTYVVDNLGDVVTEEAAKGRDGVRSAVSLVLAVNVEDLSLDGPGPIDGTGNAQANVITGTEEANRLYGLGGDDNLSGGGGDDELDGGSGADRLAGGASDDTYGVDNAADVVVEAADGGTDTVRASIGLALAANLENLVLLGSAANGTGNDLANRIEGNDGDNRLLGGDAADVLIGGGGNDTLDGGAGADRMQGGADDDLYNVENARDQVSEGTDAGRDTVRSVISHTLAANVEDLVLEGAGLTGTGNELANTITGASSGSELNGAGGGDSLVGGGGSDRLDGGTGSDRMEGGAGNDRYLVDAAIDVVVEIAGGGYDTVEAAVSFVLADNVEKLVLGGAAVEGIGNAVSNAIEGNGLANRLFGIEGNDRLVGLGGNDRLGGGGGGDRLLGGAGRDALNGEAGNDTLIGGIGRDLLSGGTGEDRFNFLAAEELGNGNQRDVILDFVHGIDLIDFKRIDANTGRRGDQRFDFIGDDAFSGSASELRYVNGIASADTNGDGRADLQVRFANASVLDQQDFVL